MTTRAKKPRAVKPGPKKKLVQWYLFEDQVERMILEAGRAGRRTSTHVRMKLDELYPPESPRKNYN